MKKSILSACLLAFLASGYANANETYDSNQIADIFYKLNGDANDPHRKVNHAKGFCTSGNFEPTKDIVKSLDVPFLDQKSIPAQVRYSLGGAIMSDKSKPRGMAIKMQDDKGSWTMVMLGSEINFAKNPQEFGQYFEMRIPVDGKVDQEKIKRLTQEVDSYRNFEEYMKNVGVSSSVANTAYYSIHTFYFKDKKSGKMLPARWKFVPVEGVKYLSDEELKKVGDNYLLERFQEHIKSKPIEYKMYLVYANKDDITNDTTALWKGKHKEVLVGTLKVSKYDGMDCNADVYFPSDLPDGVGAPNDPLFQIRNETYGVTFGRRQ